MFDNVGRTIKIIAKILFFAGVIGSVALGIVIGDFGILYWIAGTLASYLSTIILYAFGELVENSRIIASKTASNDKPVEIMKASSAPILSTKYCPKCDHLNDANRSSCSNCGHRFNQ